MVVLGSTKHRKTSQAPLGRNDTCCFHRSYSIFVLRCSTDSGGNSLSHGQGHPQSNLRGRAKTSSKFSGDTAFLEGLISQIGRDVQEGHPLTPQPKMPRKSQTSSFAGHVARCSARHQRPIRMGGLDTKPQKCLLHRLRRREARFLPLFSRSTVMHSF